MADTLAFTAKDSTSAAIVADADYLKNNKNIDRSGTLLRWLLNEIKGVRRHALTLGVHTVATRAALTALTKANLVLTVADTDSPYLVFRVLDDGSGNWGYYRWAPSSSAAVSDNVLATDEGGAGRWIALFRDVASNSARSVVAAAADRVTNVAVETAFATTFAVAASTFAAGDRLKVNAGFKVVAVNAADTLALALRLGGVAGVVVLSVPATLYQAGDYVRMSGTFPIASVGAGGTLHRDVLVSRSVLAAPRQEIDHEFDLSCPTNVARNVTATALWSVANAGNQVDLRDLEVEILSA